MDREVHYELTRQWALEEGFTAEEAQAIADADWACDSRYITTLAHKRYHWPIFGSPIISRRRLGAARATGDLALLGESLHAAQDTIGHGVLGHFYHWPGIDRLERRNPQLRGRLERRTKRILADYRGAHPSADPSPDDVS